MAIHLHTDLERLSWDELICLKLYLESVPRGTVKNRWLRLQKVGIERRRRQKEGLIPKDLPAECPW